MSYSDKAAALARQSGETPGTVQQFLDRLEAAGYSPEDAEAKYATTGLAELTAELEKAEKK